MAITVFLDGLRFFVKNQDLKSFIEGSILNQNFQAVFAMELLLLTGGFLSAALIFRTKNLSFTWRGNVMAGIGAVLLLGVLSILAQPMSMFLIVIASLFTGGFSVLFMSHKTHQVMTS